MSRNTRQKIDRAVQKKTEDAAKVLYSFRVKAKNLERLKAISEKQGTTVTQLLEAMIEQYLKP